MALGLPSSQQAGPEQGGGGSRCLCRGDASAASAASAACTSVAPQEQPRHKAVKAVPSGQRHQAWFQLIMRCLVMKSFSVLKGLIFPRGKTSHFKNVFGVCPLGHGATGSVLLQEAALLGLCCPDSMRQ